MISVGGKSVSEDFPEKVVGYLSTHRSVLYGFELRSRSNQHSFLS